MHKSRMAILAGGLICFTLAAQAQSLSPQELDRLSKERENAQGPRDWGAPPPMSQVPKDNLKQPKGLLVCRGTEQWQPVYSAPSKSSPVLGETLDKVAVNGSDQDGFTPILFQNGKQGYIPASSIREYHNEFDPKAICKIAGLRANGGPVFSVQ